MAECIVFANHKGGTGKTTSCVSIAGYLSQSGSTVLVVDLDPQANATSALGIDVMAVKGSMYDVLLNYCDGYGGMPITQVILETGVENLHVAPAERDLAVAEVLLQGAENRAYVVSRVLDEVRASYDFVLIDTPPSARILTINGLCASDQVVVPLEPSIFSLEALDNLKMSFDEATRLAGHSVRQFTAVLTRYIKPTFVSRAFRRSYPSKDVEARLRETFHPVFVVPESVEIYVAQKKGVPISHHAPRSGAGKAYAAIATSIALNANWRSAPHRVEEE